MIDTSNNSTEMDAKKTAFLFIMNFQILVLRVGLGPGKLRLTYKSMTKLEE